MIFKHNTLNFRGQSIYIGIDVHKKMWTVSIYTDEFEHKTFTSPPKVKVLVGYLHRNFPGAIYRCAYEAGYSGYWICEDLRKEAIECIVVNPSDIPSREKERRFKNDRIDSRKLARSLRNGELEGIYVPSRERLEDSSLVRMRYLIVKKLSRTKNQIKAMLNFYGLGVDESEIKSNWSKKYVSRIETTTFSQLSGNTALRVLLQVVPLGEEYKHLRNTILELTKQIRLLSHSNTYRDDVKNLITVPGISMLTAMILLTELNNIGRFKTLDKLTSYVGIVPGEHSSGESEQVTGISHRGNSMLRRILIESSWVAVKKDPALLMSYKSYCKRMCKNKAIVKIARKLLSRIRYVLLNKQSYVMGVIN